MYKITMERLNEVFKNKGTSMYYFHIGRMLECCIKGCDEYPITFMITYSFSPGGLVLDYTPLCYDHFMQLDGNGICNKCKDKEFCFVWNKVTIFDFMADKERREKINIPKDKRVW